MTEGLPKAKNKKGEKLNEEAAPVLPPTLAEAPLSPETIEKIMETVQDINNFSGLIHSTNPSGLEIILDEGLNSQEGSKARWGYAGRIIPKKASKALAFYLAVISRNNDHFSKWDAPWSEVVSHVILFDTNKLPNLDIYHGFYRDQNGHSHELRGDKLRDDVQKFSQDDVEVDELSISYGQAIPPEAIAGIVISPRGVRLDRDLQKSASTSKHLDLSEAQIIDITKHRLNRLVNREVTGVPVYRNTGDLLWPKQMSYEEVKKYVAKRDAQRNKEKVEAVERK